MFCKIPEKWLSEYDCERLNESLNSPIPEEYRIQLQLPEYQEVRETKMSLFTIYLAMTDALKNGICRSRIGGWQ